MARTVPIGQSGIDPYMGKANYITIICPSGAVLPVESPMISNNAGVHQGMMLGWKCTTNDTTNGITYGLSIKDRDGDVIYTSAGGHADNSTVIVMSLEVPLIEREKIVITPSGNPGASTLICHVTLYYDPDADIVGWS